MIVRISASLSLLLLLGAGCSGSMNTRPAAGNRAVTPSQVAIDPSLLTTGAVEWGGVIVEPLNLESTTQLQIIAYPLQRSGKPDLTRSPTGRFIAVIDGYLETADYASGRRVTLSGPVVEIRQGSVGEADYLFPVVQPQTLNLWPIESQSSGKSRVHFGIGVGSGGRTGGSVGVGVGF